MGRFGHPVIDADGHGGEPGGWRRQERTDPAESINPALFAGNAARLYGFAMPETA